MNRYNKSYDFIQLEEYIIRNKDENIGNMNKELCNNHIENAIHKLNMNLDTAHKLSKLPSKFSQNKANRRLMANANDKFNDYRESLKHGVEEEITDALNTYYQARKRLHGTVLNAEHNRWTAAIVGNDSKKLWSMIDWDGNMVNKPLTTQPPISCMKDHFEELYTPEDPLELVKIQDLYTNVNIPILDNPITEAELIDTMKDCKKGGYDYCLPVLNILTKHLLPVILLLFNMIFYTTYPVNLACSLLITIPKTGNLKLPKNFRGIQMLPALGVLYDRIITKRLEKWIYVHDEQTGFQKGKSTITQIFTLRLIIAIAKKSKTSLYIACFDIAKTFDRVSRLLLFHKLIKLGIGYAMLAALKAIYTSTCCVLCMNNILMAVRTIYQRSDRLCSEQMSARSHH